MVSLGCRWVWQRKHLAQRILLVGIFESADGLYRGTCGGPHFPGNAGDLCVLSKDLTDGYTSSFIWHSLTGDFLSGWNIIGTTKRRPVQEGSVRVHFGCSSIFHVR